MMVGTEESDDLRRSRPLGRASKPQRSCLGKPFDTRPSVGDTGSSRNKGWSTSGWRTVTLTTVDLRSSVTPDPSEKSPDRVRQLALVSGFKRVTQRRRKSRYDCRVFGHR